MFVEYLIWFMDQVAWAVCIIFWFPRKNTVKGMHPSPYSTKKEAEA